jgi:hypothetical protein
MRKRKLMKNSWMRLITKRRRKKRLKALSLMSLKI